jgi:hypothetical protein
MAHDRLYRITDGLNFMTSSNILGRRSGSRSDRNRIQSMLAIGNQLAIRHDETRSDTADARTSIDRQNRLDGFQQQRVRKVLGR